MFVKPEAKFEPQTYFKTLGSKKQDKTIFNVSKNKSNSIFNKYVIMLILIFSLSHLFGIIGLVNIFRGNVYPATVLLAIVLAELGVFGTTIGAHRLWSHKSFKARTPLKILLVFLHSLAGQASIYRWVMWHRLHHKFVDTDGDPHNSTRGFFYSHIGWIITYDHSKLVPYLAKIDMSDLKNDPIVAWNRKYYMKYCFLPLVIIFPVLISVYLIGETVLNAFYVAGCLKFIYSSHSTFLINSVAHTWGSRPYDKNITARNNRFVSLFALGEGWHNYHHAFPRDYKTSEFGLYRWNLSAALIDFFACIGWAYDLQKTRPDEIEKRVNRTADKSIHENQLLG